MNKQTNKIKDNNEQLKKVAIWIIMTNLVSLLFFFFGFNPFNSFNGENDYNLRVFPKNHSDYENQRLTLVQKDEDLRFSSDIRLNGLENKADTNLKKVVEELQKNADENYPPSLPFSRAKPVIDKSPLFPIVEKIPKGAILHIHDGGCGDYRLNLNYTYLPNCYLDIKNHRIEFFDAKYDFSNNDSDWVLFSTLRKNSENVTLFDEELLNGFRLIENKFEGTVDSYWAKFNKYFGFVDRLFTYIPVFEAYYYQTFYDIAERGTYYVELRVIYSTFLYDLKGEYKYTDVGLELLKKIEKQVQLSFPKFILKIILTLEKHSSIESMEKDFDVAVDIYNSDDNNHGDFSKFVVAFDFVGQEDTTHKLSALANLVITGQNRALHKNLKPIPLVLHAGETLSSSTSENLYDSLILDAKRIGHGFALTRFPNLMAEVKRRNVVIEICPISNQMLKLVDDIRDHPAVQLMSAGISVVIASDDPGIFSTSSVNYDWFQAILSWNLSLGDIKKIALDSIMHSFASDAEKTKLLKVWQKDWYRFCNYLARIN